MTTEELNDYRILYLSGDEVSAMGAGDMQMALEDVENTFALLHRGEAIVPEKISMGFGKSFLDEAETGRINAMPGYLGGKYNIAGIKWIGSNPVNLKAGLPRASSITILNDPDTKFPVCMMNGSEISAVRTGASSGVAAKYLARKGAETLMLVGAGYQNMKQLEAIYGACPQLKYFFVVDIAPEVGKRFAREMGEKLGIEIVPVTKIADCTRTPDITVNATSAPVPVMDPSVARPGNLQICVGGLDYPGLYAMADKIICDSWPQVRHRNCCYLALDANAGKYDERKIYAESLGEIICGDKIGRANDEEFIYYKPVGMGILDLSIASRVYRKALAEGVGTFVKY